MDSLDENIHEIKFDNNDALTKFISLNRIVNFFHQDILERKESYFEDCTSTYKKIIRDYIYEDFFEYYYGCKNLYTLLIRSSDANEKVLDILINDASDATKIMNNFENYFP